MILKTFTVNNLTDTTGQYYTRGMVNTN